MGYHEQPRTCVEEVTMNSFEKLIAAERNAGRVVPSDILVVRDTTPGVTDALYVNNVLDALGDSYPAFTGALQRNMTASIPELQDIATKTLGYKDDTDKDGGKKAWEKFIENFPKDVEKNKKLVLGTPELGERGWETVKKIWQQAATDKMLADIPKAREAELDRGVPGKVSGILQQVFTPRVRKAWIEGRDPEPSEYFMDAAQNVAYAAPIGGVGAGVSRILGNTVGARAAGTTLANALAPTAISVGDYALDTKDYANGADVATDAAIGTLTNLGIGSYLAPKLGAALNAGLVTKRVPRTLVNFLEGHKSPAARASDIIAESEDKLRRHFGENNADFIKKIVEDTPTDRLTDDKLRDYIEVLAARDMLKDKAFVNRVTENLRTARASGKSLNGYNPAKNVSKVSLGELDDLVTAQKAKKPLETIVDELVPDGKINKAPEGIEEFLEKKGGNRAAAAARAMKNHPELISQFDRPPVKEVLMDPSLRADALKSWTLNRLGNDAAAQRIANRLGIDVKDLRKKQDEGRRERRAMAAVSDIIGGAQPGTLTETDKRFLADIANKPSIVQFGHDTDPEGFKLWLLERGHDLLRGTEAHRPLWKVE